MGTYRPSSRTGADPVALTSALILAGASRLAFPFTLFPTAAGVTETRRLLNASG